MKEFPDIQNLPCVISGNNHHLDDGEMQIVVKHFPGNAVKIEKVAFLIRRASHQQVQIIHDNLEFGENAVGLMTDFGNEQKIGFSLLLLRFICTLHTAFVEKNVIECKILKYGIF